MAFADGTLGIRVQVVGDDLFVTSADRVREGILIASVTAVQLKSGAPARGERVAKYNRLLEITDEYPELPPGPREPTLTTSRHRTGDPMNEPSKETRPATVPGAYVPRKITGPVLMGVVPGQPLAVAHRAAELAYSLNVELICAYVDITTYLAEEPDGRIEARPIDPDGIDDDIEGISAGIAERLRDALDGTGIHWSFATLAGDPARALGRLAESTDASIIVVGTPERGLGARFEELLVGSTAVHLTHRQHRPVLVVPLAPHPKHHPKEGH